MHDGERTLELFCEKERKELMDVGGSEGEWGKE